MLRWTPEQADEYAKRTGINVPVTNSGSQSKPAQQKPAITSEMQGTPLTPSQRTQALGRMKSGQMNKTEEKYHQYLAMRKAAGEVVWFAFEGMKLRLADRTFYTADFVVMLVTGQLELHEVKGFWEDDARVKIKVAAEQYPFRFVAVQANKNVEGPDWIFEDFSPWYNK